MKVLSLPTTAVPMIHTYLCDDRLKSVSLQALQRQDNVVQVSRGVDQRSRRDAFLVGQELMGKYRRRIKNLYLTPPPPARKPKQTRITPNMAEVEIEQANENFTAVRDLHGKAWQKRTRRT